MTGKVQSALVSGTFSRLQKNLPIFGDTSAVYEISLKKVFIETGLGFITKAEVSCNLVQHREKQSCGPDIIEETVLDICEISRSNLIDCTSDCWFQINNHDENISFEFRDILEEFVCNIN